MGWKMASLASRQHGIVTRRQLLALGLSAAGIGRRIVGGVLHVEYRGVYRVGHRAPSVAARYAAAVLAGGEGAALSGPAAAHHYGFLRRDPPAPEVTTTLNRKLPGAIVHRARAIPADETRRWHGIRVLTVPRLLVDLAGTLSLDALARVHHEAHIRFKVSAHEVERILARRPTAKGIEGLRAVVRGDTPLLLSQLERGFRRILREHRLPMPLFNRAEGAHYVDCRWPQHRLTVELDSFRFHNTRLVWEQDRQRDRKAHDRGDRLRRFTWRDVFEDQRHMLRQLDHLLARK